MSVVPYIAMYLQIHSHIGILTSFTRFTWKHLCRSLFFNEIIDPFFPTYKMIPPVFHSFYLFILFATVNIIWHKNRKRLPILIKRRYSGFERSLLEPKYVNISDICMCSKCVSETGQITSWPFRLSNLQKLILIFGIFFRL